MHRSQRRLIALAIGLTAFVIGSALLYQVGMLRLEGKHRTFWDAIEWAARPCDGYANNRRAVACVVGAGERPIGVEVRSLELVPRGTGPRARGKGSRPLSASADRCEQFKSA